MKHKMKISTDFETILGCILALIVIVGSWISLIYLIAQLFKTKRRE